MKIKLMVALMGLAGSAWAGSLDPSAGPSPTMRTMDELYGNQTNMLAQLSLIASPRSLSASTTTVAAGFYSATDLVTVDADLAAENIRDGITIFGIEGTVQSGASYSVGPWPTAGVITNGDALSGYALNGGDATVPGTFSWTDGSVIPPAGVSTQAITFTPDDPADAAVESKIVVTVAYDGRWVDNGDGTITDLQKGIMWVQAPQSLPNAPWTDPTGARTFVNDLVFAGYDDWRLPQVAEGGMAAELDSLYGFGSWAGKPAAPFSGILSQPYWSANARSSSETYVVNMADGWVGGSSNSAGRYVWPVRSIYQ